MIIFAIIAAVLLLLIALVLLLPAYVGIEYEYREGRQKLLVHMRLLGIPIKIRVPIGEAQKKQKKKKAAEKDTATETEAKKKFTFSRFREIAGGIRDAYQESKEDIRLTLAQIRKKTELESVAFHLGFGLSDAAKTGIATGAAWTSSSCLLSVVNQMVGIKTVDLRISPDFTRETFSIYIKSILKLRPVHIISIGIKIIKIVNLFIEKMNLK